MAVPRKPLHWLLLVTAVLAEPAPGRVPKVYNALITSNQNLESSKAYPVYQPVLHDLAFPYQPAVFYGDYPIANGIQPASPELPKDQDSARPLPVPTPQESKSTDLPSTESSLPPSKPSNPASNSGLPTPAQPLAPNTESPIPLNEFGLPSQVLPLGRINPAYNGFTQIGPFTYSYPSVRFYNPYDPFSFNPYANLPSLYQPFHVPPNFLEATAPEDVRKEASLPRVDPTASAVLPPGQTPPSEPVDLNVLNYASKDPAIPNVPPPPLPHGGLKDKPE